MPTRVLTAAALMLLACSTCKRSGTPEPPVDEILVGEYGSMTGAEANFGQATHNGLVMAIEEINAAGGVKGKQVRLISYDDQGKTSEVGTAVMRLITSDRVLAIIGEVSSSLSIAGGQIAQHHGVPMISPSSTSAMVTEMGEYVFRVCFIDPFQGYVMARFATDPKDRHGLGLKRLALLIDERQPYSQGLGKHFEQALARLGGTIVAKESYQGGDQDYSAQLTRIRETRPEAIYVPGYYTDVANIGKQARGLGLSAPLLGGDGWESVTEIAGNSLDGSYYSSHYATSEDRPAVQRFVQTYKRRHGIVPDSMAALGYDAMMLLKDAIERAPTIDRKAVRDALALTRGFEGLTGKITIDANRNASKPATVLRISGRESIPATSIAPP